VFSGNFELTIPVIADLWLHSVVVPNRKNMNLQILVHLNIFLPSSLFFSGIKQFLTRSLQLQSFIECRFPSLNFKSGIFVLSNKAFNSKLVNLSGVLSFEQSKGELSNEADQ
jgi:hypothetical protein